MEFWEILNYAMNETNTSNYRLAKMLGVHPSTVASWRSGITEPKYDMLVKIENIFKIALVPSRQTPLETPDEENPWELALLEAFEKLNLEGQKKAVERIEELTEIPKYQK